MSVATSPSKAISTDPSARRWLGAAALIAVWFGTILILTLTGVMDPGPNRPPVPLVFAVAIPTLLFLGAYRALPRFKAMVLGADLRLITALHAWRTIGFGFILLHLNGLLPGLFAWPAGLGDVAIAIAAPWMVYRLLRDPDFVTSSRFLWWNRLGILDFVVAFIAGALASGVIPALTLGGVNTAAVSVMPMALIPGFLVPLLLLTHLTALLQIGEARRQAAGRG